MSSSISDLRQQFFGNSDAELAALQAYADAGIGAADVLEMTRGVSTGALAKIGLYACTGDGDQIVAANYFVNDTEYASAIRLPAGTYDRISVRALAAGEGTAIIRLGIRENRLDGYPGDVILDVTGPGNGSGAREITINQTLEAGLYWLTLTNQGAPVTTPNLVAMNVPSVQMPQSSVTAGSGRSFKQTGVSGALGAFSSTVTMDTNGPRIFLRRAS